MVPKTLLLMQKHWTFQCLWGKFSWFSARITPKITPLEKSMPYKDPMGWEKGRQRWIKMHRGVRLKFSREMSGLSEADWNEDNSRPLMREWFATRKEEIDGGLSATIEDAVKSLPSEEELQATIKRGELAKSASEIRAAVEASASLPEILAQLGVPPYALGSDYELISGIDHLSRSIRGDRVAIGYELKYSVKQFKEDERARVESGDIGPETYGEFCVYMDRICEELGIDVDVRTINEQTVTFYNNKIRRSAYVPSTKRKAWRFFVRLMKYLYSMRLIDLPRNIDDRQIKRVPVEAVPRYQLGDIQALLPLLTDRQRLYAFLGLNCGMLGVDMASMTWTELHQNSDLASWRIKRKRTKTCNSSDQVPIVNYRLWLPTVRLLKANLSSHPQLVLTSKENTPLWNSYIDEGGKRKKSDLITQQWRRSKFVKGKAESKKAFWINLKSFRSIGATIIGDHKEYGRYYHHYLGHSPQSIGDRHYVPPSDELFDEILAYVGKTLGLV